MVDATATGQQRIRRRRILAATGSTRGDASKPAIPPEARRRSTSTRGRGLGTSRHLGPGAGGCSVYANGLYWHLESGAENVEDGRPYLTVVGTVENCIPGRDEAHFGVAVWFQMALAPGGGALCCSGDAVSRRLRNIYPPSHLWRRGGVVGTVHQGRSGHGLPSRRATFGTTTTSSAHLLGTEARIDGTALGDELQEPEPLPGQDTNEDDRRESPESADPARDVAVRDRSAQILLELSRSPRLLEPAANLKLDWHSGLHDAGSGNGPSSGGAADHQTGTSHLAQAGGLGTNSRTGAKTRRRHTSAC